MPTPLKIDFVSDVVCPWCAVGLYGLTRALDRLKDEGVTAALLRRHGIPVFSEEQLDEVEALLAQLEGKTP